MITYTQIQDDQLRACFQRVTDNPHRMHYITTVRNVRYVDDAAAGSVYASWYTLDTMPQHVIWIMEGQYHEQVDWDFIHPLVVAKCELVIVISTTTSPAVSYFNAMGVRVVEANSIDSAIHAAYVMSHDGDTVLYSPATTQLCNDLDVEGAGQHFIQSARRL